MNPSLVVASLGALVGGVVGALVTLAVRPSPEPAQAAPEKGAEVAAAEIDETSEDEDEDGLVRRIQSLERRLSLLTTAYARANGDKPEPGTEPTPSQADVADPVFEAAVLDIFDREQERAKDERAARRAEVQKERTERAASALREKLGLSGDQEQRLLAIMTAHFESVQKLRDSEDAPTTRAEWRTRMTQVNAASEQKMGEVLTPSQLSDYQKLEPEDRLGGGRGQGQGNAGRRDNAETAAPDSGRR